MCGIVGIISKQHIDISVLKAMNDQMHHRGPDGEGLFVVGQSVNDVTNIALQKQQCQHIYNVGFGHKRLSIVDLSALGHQPMSYLDRYWITYNGEIYNHIELRQELEQLGYQFVSHTDTEVILAAYDQWGVECFNKFNGMWAFAIYDSKNQEVILSRDRFGVKPLYIYHDNDHFIFASEIKAILKHPKVAFEPDIEQLQYFIDHGTNEWQTTTCFKGITRFDANSYARIALKNDTIICQPQTFWSCTVNTSNEKFDQQKAKQIAKQYYALLKDAVKLRLRADVDVGAALSGGLDSSSIVYLIDEIRREQKKSYSVETFSTIYPSKETKDCDESYYIDIVSKHLKVKSHTIEPTAKNFSNQHPQVIKYYESPPGLLGISCYSTLELVATTPVKVTLDGQGADEQQAGYEHHAHCYLCQQPLLQIWQQYINIKNNFVPNLHLQRVVVAYAYQLLGQRVTSFFLKLLGKNLSVHIKPLNQALWQNFTTSLKCLIHYSDSRSMRFSIESRMPFLDYRLVEFMFQVPACYKLHNGWSKYFARLAFDGKLPNEICWRKDKKGWPEPKEQLLRNEQYQWAKQLIQQSTIIPQLKAKGFDHYLTKDIKSATRLLNIAAWEHFFNR